MNTKILLVANESPDLAIPKSTPSTSWEGIWIFLVAFGSFLAFAGREFVSYQRDAAKSQIELHAEEQRKELEERQASIKHLQELNLRLIADLCNSKHALECANCNKKEGQL